MLKFFSPSMKTQLRAIFWRVHPNPPLVFVHVGKCAGSSLKSMLDLGGRSIWHVHERQPPVSRAFDYITVIRHPVSRFVSAFRMLKMRGDNLKMPNSELKKRILDCQDAENFCREFLSDKTLRDSIQQNPQGAGHLGMGLDFYLGGLVSANDEGWSLRVLTQENFIHDAALHFPEHRIPHRLNAGASHWHEHLTEDTGNQMREALWRDFEVIESLNDKGLIRHEAYRKIIQ